MKHVMSLSFYISLPLVFMPFPGSNPLISISKDK